MKTILKFINPAFAVLVLACFAVSPPALAQLPSPTPDGGYPGGNTAEGNGALASLTTGLNNTAVGSDALGDNTAGSRNTATGLNALFHNTGGHDNTAAGFEALVTNVSGNFNTANGVNALLTNSSGVQNTADGVNALYSNTTGNFNTADGVNALLHNTTGSSNVGIGTNGGRNLTTGSGNVCIGVNVNGVAGESNTTRIRNIFSSVASARAVFVNSDSKLGTLSSSRRYKEEIKAMDKASETLFALKPVTFRYKKDIDPARALSFGLIAEEVAQVDPDLITRDEEGKPETVRYEAINAMLLNEFLKEHRKNEKQETTIAELKSEIATLSATVKEQASQIQKVSAQLELSRPASQAVLNNH
jgi:trimeric autotransporter adhesin